jgi:hypothetical protein
MTKHISLTSLLEPRTMEEPKALRIFCHFGHLVLVINLTFGFWHLALIATATDIFCP